MVVPAAGLVLLIAVGVMGLGVAVGPALLVSYGAALVMLGRSSLWQRLMLQAVIFLFALAACTVLATVGLFVGFEGNMGSNLTLWGREMFDQPIVFASLAAVPFFVGAGEVAMMARRWGLAASDAPGSGESP